MKNSQPPFTFFFLLFFGYNIVFCCRFSFLLSSNSHNAWYPSATGLGLHMSNGVSDNYTLCILVCYNARVREFEGCELVALSFSSSFFTLHSSVVEFQDIDFFPLTSPFATRFSLFFSLHFPHDTLNFLTGWNEKISRIPLRNFLMLFMNELHVNYHFDDVNRNFDGSEINLLFYTLVLFFFHSRDGIFPLLNARTNGARKRKGIIEKAQTQID